MLPFPEQLIATVLGTIVLALASSWLRQKGVAHRWLRGAWWAAWLGSAGFSYYCMLRATAVVGDSVAPEERATQLVLWLDRGNTWRLVALAVLVVGLLAGGVAIMRRGSTPGSGRLPDAGGEPRA